MKKRRRTATMRMRMTKEKVPWQWYRKHSLKPPTGSPSILHPKTPFDVSKAGIVHQRSAKAWKLLDITLTAWKLTDWNMHSYIYIYSYTYTVRRERERERERYREPCYSKCLKSTVHSSISHILPAQSVVSCALVKEKCLPRSSANCGDNGNQGSKRD